MADGFEVVVKPRVRTAYGKTAERRRLVIVEEVYDDLGGDARFERCVEETPSGSRQQYLLRRVRQEGRRATQWEHDLHMMSQLRHFNILQYDDSWVSRDGTLHVLCYDARMFLSVCLRKMAPERPSGVLYELWLIHIVSALEYMHDHNEDQPMLHRNVQPDNILITDKGVLKLCAFGVAKRLGTMQGKAETRMAGGLFKSPEMQQGRPYDQLTDIWSFGVTAVYMADYHRARTAGSKERLLAILQESGQSSVTMKVVSQALRSEPAERPKTSSIVKYLQQHGSHGDNLQPSTDILPSSLLNASKSQPSPNVKDLPDPQVDMHTSKTQERQEFLDKDVPFLPRTTGAAAVHAHSASSRSTSETQRETHKLGDMPLISVWKDGSRDQFSQTSTPSHGNTKGTSSKSEAGKGQNFASTADMTTQTSFHTIAPERVSNKETGQTNSTQTTQTQLRKTTQVTLIQHDKSLPWESREEMKKDNDDRFSKSTASTPASASTPSSIPPPSPASHCDQQSNRPRHPRRSRQDSGHGNFADHHHHYHHYDEENPSPSRSAPSPNPLLRSGPLLPSSAVSRSPPLSRSGPVLSSGPVVSYPPKRRTEQHRKFSRSRDSRNTKESMNINVLQKIDQAINDAGVMSKRRARSPVRARVAEGKDCTNTTPVQTIPENKMLPALNKGATRLRATEDVRTNSQMTADSGLDMSLTDRTRDDKASVSSCCSCCTPSSSESSSHASLSDEGSEPTNQERETHDLYVQKRSTKQAFTTKGILSPIFAREWQHFGSFSCDGGTLRKPGSDVTLHVPIESVKRGSSVAISAAVFADPVCVRSKMKLPEDEEIMSPVAEYRSGEDFQFQRAVTVKLPHWLPPDFDPDCVRVYHVSVSDDRKIVTTAIEKDVTSNPHDRDGRLQREDGKHQIIGDAATKWRQASRHVDNKFKECASFSINEDHVTISTDHFCGFVCTYCKKKTKGKQMPTPLLYVMVSETPVSTTQVNVNASIWDARIKLEDCRKDHDIMKGKAEQLNLVSDCSRTTFTLKLRMNELRHRLDQNGQPLLPEEKNFSESMICCQKCLQKGKLLPRSFQWALEYMPPVTRTLEVAVDITHTAMEHRRSERTTVLLTLQSTVQQNHQAGFGNTYVVTSKTSSVRFDDNETYQRMGAWGGAAPGPSYHDLHHRHALGFEEADAAESGQAHIGLNQVPLRSCPNNKGLLAEAPGSHNPQRDSVVRGRRRTGSLGGEGVSTALGFVSDEEACLGATGRASADGRISALSESGDALPSQVGYSGTMPPDVTLADEVRRLRQVVRQYEEREQRFKQEKQSLLSQITAQGQGARSQPRLDAGRPAPHNGGENTPGVSEGSSSSNLRIILNHSEASTSDWILASDSGISKQFEFSLTNDQVTNPTFPSSAQSDLTTAGPLGFSCHDDDHDDGDD